MPQQIKLMADYHCWPLWWAGDHDPGNIDPATLPLAPDTIGRLEAWSDTFDANLNLDDPASSGFASETAAVAFEQEGLELWRQLQQELTPQYEVTYYSLRQRRLLTSPTASS